jgi:dTDP-4-dehydrorhamnose reductase
MKILGTGLSGLVGGRIVELLQDRYEFENLSLETGVDITKPGVVDEYIAKSEAPWVWHFAARTDVDGIEAEKSQGEHSLTWTVNVKATEHVM